MRKLLFTTLLICSCSFVQNSMASVIQMANTDGSFLLNSNSIDGLFNSDTPYFTTSDMALVHSTLNNWGVDTDGKVTILPVNTDAGLALLTLVDMELGGGDIEFDSSIGVTSTGSSGLSMFINDADQDNWTLIQPPFGSQTLGATFVWGSLGSGDGFAWAGFLMGDTVSYTFNDLGADSLSEDAFQFVGWNNDAWEVVATHGFDSSGTSVFTGIVIPGPSVVAIIGVMGFGYTRRRR